MHRRLPSLNALRAFEVAARHCSFSLAASELFVTHAAVSRHIRHLEAWLNVALFRRTGRGVVLTEIGEQYARRLSDTFDEMANATRHVLQMAETPQLTISVEEAFATHWLVPRLVRFTERYPEVELTIDPNDERVNFRSESVDMAVRYGDGNWPDVNLSLLVRLQVFPVCSPEYRERRNIEVPADLTNAVLLHEETKAWWADWLATAGLDGLAASRGPLYRGHLAVEAATAGQGFALGDNVTAADGLLEGWLVKPFDIRVEEEGYYIVRAKGSTETAPAQAFREWLVEEMAETQTKLKPFLDE